MRFFIILLFFEYYFSSNWVSRTTSVLLLTPMLLSGNFGELRPNHFHSGFDQNVAARRFGFLSQWLMAMSRIKISPSMEAIYITHPNGYCILSYCQRDWSKAIFKRLIIRKVIWDRNVLKPNELVVKKDKLLHYRNTGSSEGPHLHFEFRDSETEKIINPLLVLIKKWRTLKACCCLCLSGW
jgi:hypothetical protein